MKAVILAAGEGSRMHPLTYTRPKAMLPVAGRPILEHLLLEMAAAGLRQFIVVVGYRAEKIQSHFGGGGRWGIDIEYRLQGEPRGTGDALVQVAGTFTEPFVVVNGDSIIGHDDIAGLMAYPGPAMAVKEVADLSAYGAVEVESGCLRRIHEKSAHPPTRLANAGLYVLTPAIFPVLAGLPASPRGEFELPAALERLVTGGARIACRHIDAWIDMSYPWDLLAANGQLLSDLRGKNQGRVEAGAVISGACSIGAGTTIRAGSYVTGPAVIGAGCDIGPNCYIRPATSIGDGCHIGAGVEIKNSIIMCGTKIPHLSYVGDSVIGENCNLGAGTIIANLKFDGANVVVADRDTLRRKFGAVMGDDVKTGINASINAGTFIGNDSWIGPGVLAHGLIEPGSRIF